MWECFWGGQAMFAIFNLMVVVKLGVSFPSKLLSFGFRGELHEFG